MFSEIDVRSVEYKRGTLIAKYSWTAVSFAARLVDPRRSLRRTEFDHRSKACASFRSTASVFATPRLWQQL
jgi:hypothetical protein